MVSRELLQPASKNKQKTRMMPVSFIPRLTMSRPPYSGLTLWFFLTMKWFKVFVNA
jgi:hypothetical protein